MTEKNEKSVFMSNFLRLGQIMSRIFYTMWEEGDLCMKIKIDKYVVPGKKRSYEILMFPNYQNMYAYDGHPREEMYEVDGDEEAVRALAAAAAILAVDLSKILYFPCKKRGFWMNDDYSLVMARTELQFRRSEWYRLKPKLDKRHWRGKYVFNYQPGKLVDYYVRLENDWRWKGWEKKERKKYVGELLGDTVFWILPRNLCYEYHAYLAENVKAFQEENFKVQLGYVGWLMKEEWLQEFTERIDRNMGEEPLSESAIYKDEKGGFRIDVCFCVTRQPYFKVYKGSWNGDIYLKKVRMCRIQICRPEYMEGIGSGWVLDEGEKEKLMWLLKEESRYAPGLTNWQVLLREYRYQEEKGSGIIGVPDCFVMPDYTLLPARKEEKNFV